MARLIDADLMAAEETGAFISAQAQITDTATRLVNEVVHKKIQMLLADAPTAEIARPTRSQFKRMAAQLGYKEVVYCKDCEFAEPYEREDGEIGYYCHNEKHSFVYGATWERKFNPVKEKNDFCSDGERRTDE